MTTSMNQLLDQIHNLPQIPEIIRIIIGQLNDPHADALIIAKNVEKEQLLALKVLRLVNSAHFGLSRKVNSIEEATMLIGMEQLKTLVVASGLVGCVPEIPNFDVKDFWKTTFLTASYAKWFAEKAGIQAEIAYTAGLFSGIGNILIHLGAPKEANEIDQHAKAGHSNRPELERNRLGFTNQEACGELLRRWRLSDELISAVEQSATPLANSMPNPYACAIYLGRFISNCQTLEYSASNMLTEFPFLVAEKMGITDETISTNIGSILSISSNLDGLIE